MAGLDPAMTSLLRGEKMKTWITATSTVMTPHMEMQPGLLRSLCSSQ
jgi:hypothetical protein